MESAVIVFIIVATLALFVGAAALPRSLLMLAFVTVVATVAVVVSLEIKPTRSLQTASPPVVVPNHSNLLLPR